MVANAGGGHLVPVRKPGMPSIVALGEPMIEFNQARADAPDQYLRGFGGDTSNMHRHIALYEWLLEQAKALGIHGGSAFRAIAGFGRHGILHEEHFFELAAQMTIEVEFVVTDEEAESLLGLLRQERISVFYARVPAEFGAIEGDR